MSTIVTNTVKYALNIWFQGSIKAKEAMSVTSNIMIGIQEKGGNNGELISFLPLIDVVLDGLGTERCHYVSLFYDLPSEQVPTIEDAIMEHPHVLAVSIVTEDEGEAQQTYVSKEAIIVLTDELDESEVGDFYNSFEDYIVQLGGKDFLRGEYRYRSPLPYGIGGYKRGTYLFSYAELTIAMVEKLEEYLRYNDLVLRFLILDKE